MRARTTRIVGLCGILLVICAMLAYRMIQLQLGVLQAVIQF